MNVLKNLVKGITLSANHKEEYVPDSTGIPPAQPNHHADNNNEETTTSPDEAQEDRKRLWTKLSGLIGKDTMSLLSLPVSLFEPTSVLQTMIEPLRFFELLEEASKLEDPVDRMCHVVAFGIALFSNYTRTMKPFNPLLGETYEFIPPHKKYKSMCEQVSHHPPIGIAHTFGEGWTLQQESRIQTRFWGNSVDINSIGHNHFWLPKYGDHYSWMNPSSCCHNIIFGRMWVEHHGDAVFKNTKTKHSAVVHFRKAGWFEGINYDVQGEVRDEDGNLKAVLIGKWNEFVSVSKVDDKGNREEPVVLWTKNNDPDEANHRWKWCDFVRDLTATDEEYEAILPPSDSRLRGDLRALSTLNMKLASKEKTKIEEGERQKRRDREAQGRKWSPVYFKKSASEEFEYLWEYVGTYWEDRQERVRQHKDKQREEEVNNEDMLDEADVQSNFK